ncbi:MAG: hypothetical protein WCL38_06210, partial [Actinomycetota bacterium]
IAGSPASEGLWAKQIGWTKGPPVMLSSSYRISPIKAFHAVWMRTSTIDVGLYLGTKGPGPSPFNRGPEMVPLAGRSRLLATFNAAFYSRDGAAGFYTHGTLYEPMVRGLATFIERVNGTVDIIPWVGGPHPGQEIVTARQNLTLLTAGGRPTPRALDQSHWRYWGETVHVVPAVWRSALCVDESGNLRYGAGPDLTAAGLALAMAHIGCLRSMELDINADWPIFVSYRAQGGRIPTMVIPNPNQWANRHLTYSLRDFFAIYVRSGKNVSIPW